MKTIRNPFILILMISLGAINLYPQCTSTGPRSSNSVTNNTGMGIVAWTNPSNVYISDTVASSAGLILNAGDSITTNYLIARNFGFSIPVNAMICGFTVKLKHKQQGAVAPFSTVYDHSIYLMSAGILVGQNHASTNGWTNSYSNDLYGNDTDNWGTSLTPTQINHWSFGVGISTSLQSDISNSFLSVDIDHVSIEVFYSIPLPVQVVELEALNIDNREVELNWSTLSETNSDYFTIEYSKDAIIWTEITEVNGAGTSNSLINYSFIDVNPQGGDTYYRLKQTDYNGDSQIVGMTNVHLDEQQEIKIQYNPLTTSIQVSCNEGFSGFVLIYDYTGNEVKNIPMDYSAEPTSINVNELATGIYSVIAISPKQTTMRKIYI